MALKGNMLVIIIAAASLIGGGAGGYFARGMFGKSSAGEKPTVEGEHGNGEEESKASEEESAKEEEKPSSHGGGEGHDGGEKKAEDESQLGPFIVNLADDGARRYLRTTLQLALHKESYKKYFGKLDPRMRDALLTLLSSQRTDQLLKPEGKEQLRKDIASQLNAILGKEAVEEVYFVDFLIQ
jgi:flagellar basal body-associated protein FliL